MHRYICLRLLAIYYIICSIPIVFSYIFEFDYVYSVTPSMLIIMLILFILSFRLPIKIEGKYVVFCTLPFFKRVKHADIEEISVRKREAILKMRDGSEKRISYGGNIEKSIDPEWINDFNAQLRNA